LISENIVAKKYFYPPLHLQKIYKPFTKNGEFKNTEKTSFNSLSLPLYSHMKEKIVKKICFSIKRIFKHSKEIIDSE